MAAHDVKILRTILDGTRNQLDPDMKDAEFFGFFAAQQILRGYSIDPEEIKSGIVGQPSTKKSSGSSSDSVERPGTDGGIDSIYLFVNGTLIRDRNQIRALKKLRGDILFEVIIIQSKGEPGFQLAPIIRMGNTCESILDITKKKSDFKEKYNEDLIEAIALFRAAYTALLLSSPTISVRCFYAGFRDTDKLDSNITDKAQELENKIPGILTNLTLWPFGATNPFFFL